MELKLGENQLQPSTTVSPFTKLNYAANVASTFDFHGLGIDDFTVLFILLKGTPMACVKAKRRTNSMSSNKDNQCVRFKITPRVSGVLKL